MAQQITKWKTADGKEFDSELEALRHENNVLAQQRNRAQAEAKAYRSRDDSPASSYGSSGGGGHD